MSCAIASVIALSVVAMVMPLKKLCVEQAKWLGALQAGQMSTMIILQHLHHGHLLPGSDHRLILDRHGRRVEIFVCKDSLYLQFDHKKPEGWVRGVRSLSLTYDGLPAAKVQNWRRVRGVHVGLTLQGQLPWGFYAAI